MSPIIKAGSSLLPRLVRGTYWSFAATGVASAFNLLAGVLCARSLGNEAFGQMGVLQSTVGFAALLASLGLGATATRFISRYRLSDPAACGRMVGGVLLLGGATILIGSLSLLLGAGVIAQTWLQSPGLEPSVRICAAWVFAFSWGELLMASLAGLESFRALAGLSFLRGLLVFGGTVVGLRWGLNGALIGWTAGLGASTLVLLRVMVAECARHGIRIRRIESTAELSTLLRYAVPTLISGLSYAPFAWLTNTLVARTSGGFEQLALLTAAYQWRGILTYLPVSLSRVALPLMSSSDSAGGELAQKGFSISNLVNQFVVWTCGITLMGASGPLLSLYGESFLAGRWAFILVLGSSMVGYVGNSLGSLIQARGLFRLGIIGNLLSGVSLAGCTLIYGEEFGALAVGAGSMLGYALNLIFCATALALGGHIARSLAGRIVGTAFAAMLFVVSIAQLSSLMALVAAALLLPAVYVGIFHVFAKPEGLSISTLLASVRQPKSGRAG